MSKKTNGAAIRQKPAKLPQTICVTRRQWMVFFEDTILEMDLSAYEKMTYIVLCAHAGEYGPSYPRSGTNVQMLAREASLSRTKVLEALKTLKERGVIRQDLELAEEDSAFDSQGNRHE